LLCARHPGEWRFYVSLLMILTTYHKTLDGSPRLLSVQVNQTPGLYAAPVFYPKFYGS